MSNKITDEDIDKAIVKLKPFLGIKPEIYLAVLYGTILLLGLFYLLFYPGLRNNGTLVNVETFPPGAVVYVDNVYKGSTPAKFFVPGGKREIRIEKKYFETIVTEKSIDGRIFGTLLFPKKLNISEDIKITDPEGFLKNRFRELSSYALIDEYYERYQMPPLISKTVSEFLAGTDIDNRNILYDFLNNMRVNLGSMDLADDYIFAVNLALGVTNIQPPISLKLISGFFNYFKEKENNNALNLSLLSVYPKNQRESNWKTYSAIDGIDNLPSYYETIKANFVNSGLPKITNNKLNLNGSVFVGISGGNFTSGKPIPSSPEMILEDNYISSFPHKETLDSYYIMDREVTRGDYLLFLNENPEWEKSNIEELIKNKLVNSEYLVSQDFNNTANPVSNISWYAAEAYCDWLETKLPHDINYEVRLPTEAEWEAAALLNKNSNTTTVFKESGAESSESANFTRIGSAGLYDTMGNLWEWCENWYFPTDTINGSFGLPDSSWDGVEKSVRGGSWANSAVEIDRTTRGSQDPSWSTPFLGFRPVLVKK